VALHGRGDPEVRRLLGETLRLGDGAQLSPGSNRRLVAGEHHESADAFVQLAPLRLSPSGFDGPVPKLADGLER
jgi:hypothetical protein